MGSTFMCGKTKIKLQRVLHKHTDKTVIKLTKDLFNKVQQVMDLKK